MRKNRQRMLGLARETDALRCLELDLALEVLEDLEVPEEDAPVETGSVERARLAVRITQQHQLTAVRQAKAHRVRGSA